LLCYVQLDSQSQALTYGKRLFFKAFVNPVEPPKNPQQFDYRTFLSYKKIYHQAYIRSGEWLVLGEAKSSFRGYITKIQAFLLQKIKLFVAGEAEQNVAMALILGFQEEISDELQTAYAETGAIHVLSVSGLHVGIVSMIIRFLLRGFTWRRKGVKLAMLLLPIWFFALLTGFSPSVLRAAVMFSMLQIGLESRHRPNIYNVLAAAAFILLVLDPYFLFSVGFQLSFAAVLGIVYFQPKIAIFFKSKNRFVQYFWELTTVSLAATLGTLPFTLYYFHKFPIWFWLSGAVVVPCSAFVLAAGLALFALIWLPYVNTLLGILLHWSIKLMNYSVVQIHKLPFAVIDRLWFSFAESVLVCFIVLFFGFLLQTRQMRWAIFSLGGLLILGGISWGRSLESQQQQGVAVYSLNDATAIDFINGERVYTLRSPAAGKSYDFAAKGYHDFMDIRQVDTFSLNENIALPFLKKQGSFIQFYDKSFFVLNQKINENALPQGKKLKVDYLLLSENARVKVADLTKIFAFKTLIFDASNKAYRIKQWQEECAQLGVAYHDIRQEAWILDF
jgi:competence protein ComEC